MATVLRIRSLMDINYDFNELEVGDVIEYEDEPLIYRESQLGDVTLYSEGVEHHMLEIDFINVFASTIARLNLVRLLRDRFWIYPHYLDDTDLRYCVVLRNPELVREFYYHGHPKADQVMRLIFREFTGSVCYPPVPGS